MELGLMTKEEADTLVNPILMTDPERIDAAAAEFSRRRFFGEDKDGFF